MTADTRDHLFPSLVFFFFSFLFLLLASYFLLLSFPFPFLSFFYIFFFRVPFLFSFFLFCLLGKFSFIFLTSTKSTKLFLFFTKLKRNKTNSSHYCYTFFKDILCFFFERKKGFINLSVEICLNLLWLNLIQHNSL